MKETVATGKRVIPVSLEERQIARLELEAGAFRHSLEILVRETEWIKSRGLRDSAPSFPTASEAQEIDAPYGRNPMQTKAPSR